MIRIIVTLKGNPEDYNEEIYVNSDIWYEIEQELNDKYGANKWICYKINH